MTAMNISNGSRGSEPLRAHIVKRFLPNLGSGVKLFDAPMTAAGNSKVMAVADQGRFSATA